MTQITEHLKYFTKLSSIAVFSFFKINLLGAISTIALIIMEYFLLTKNINAGSSAHVSTIPFLTMTFFARPAGSIMWYLTCVLSPILFFILGNKYIITKLTHKVITDKSESLLNPLLDKVLLKFKSKQTNPIKTAADYTIAKMKLIHDVKSESDNKWLKKIISFGLKKIQLDDVDFSQEDLSFYDIIKAKTIQSLKNISQPSRELIWIVLGIQWLFFLVIVLTKY
jgi:hypothetical protein